MEHVDGKRLELRKGLLYQFPQPIEGYNLKDNGIALATSALVYIAHRYYLKYLNPPINMVYRSTQGS